MLEFEYVWSSVSEPVMKNKWTLMLLNLSNTKASLVLSNLNISCLLEVIMKL